MLRLELSERQMFGRAGKSGAEEVRAAVDEFAEVVGAVEPQSGDQQHVEDDGHFDRPPDALVSRFALRVREQLAHRVAAEVIAAH